MKAPLKATMLHRYLDGDGQPKYLGRLARHESGPSTRDRLESLSRPIRIIEASLGQCSDKSTTLGSELVLTTGDYPDTLEETDGELLAQK